MVSAAATPAWAGLFNYKMTSCAVEFIGERPWGKYVKVKMRTSFEYCLYDRASKNGLGDCLQTKKYKNYGPFEFASTPGNYKPALAALVVATIGHDRLYLDNFKKQVKACRY